MDNNSGIKHLAQVIDKRSKQVIKGSSCSDAPFDFATVGSDLSLQLDNFSETIDAKEYLICTHCKDISAGDRVIIAWVYSEICVIGILQE